MYSTKLTVSHSTCSELMPPPKNITTLLSFVNFFSLHSKSFTSDKSSQKYIVRILLYLLCTTKHVHPLSSPANWRLDLNRKTNKQRKEGNRKRNGDFQRLGLLFLFCQSVLSGNNRTMIGHIPTLHSGQSVYKKMPSMKNTLFG